LRKSKNGHENWKRQGGRIPRETKSVVQVHALAGFLRSNADAAPDGMKVQEVSEARRMPKG
jgi:hypothetical protein